jgi:hypothetical protein
MAEETVGLYGSDDYAKEEASKYKSPKEYSAQGDTRVIRDLMFSYMVETTDTAGNSTLASRDAARGDEVQVGQIGLIALQQGEDNHSFYTSDELDNLEATGSDATPPASSSDISAFGEQELADWLKSGKDGGAFTVDEVLERVGTDKDLANRMLAAENIATDGDPRKSLEAGLTHIIEQ